MMTPSIWERKALDPAKDDIRVATLLPNPDFNAPPECDLETVSLRDGATYEAVSYVWGDPEDTVEMILGDGQASSKHPITRNLDLCLRHMRKEHDIRILWIDAICIDQNNLREKETQIVLMRDIYQEAQGVYIFLGRGSPLTERAFSTIVAVVEARSFLHARIDGRSLVPSDLRSLEALLTTEWWKRIWVVQEALLNTAVYLYAGKRGISMQMLKIFSSVYFDLRTSWSPDTREFFRKDKLNSDMSPTLMSMMMPMAELINVESISNNVHSSYEGQGDSSFLSMLAACRARKATKAQDKVYGLLGLCPQSFLDYFPPQLGLDTAQVYTNFAVACLLFTKSLTLFNQCALLPVSEHGLPSWVPDWSVSSVSLRFNATRLDVEHFYQAGTLLPLSFELIDERTLCLNGVFVDMISRVGDQDRQFDESTGQAIGSADVVALFAQWEDMTGFSRFTGRAARYVAGGTIAEAYWKTVFNDIMIPQPNATTKARRCEPSDLVQYCEMISEAQDGRWHGAAITEAQMSESQASRTRRMIVGSKGYIGMAPKSVKKDDQVYVLAGGRVPYVLRPVVNAERKDTFLLVGECYVHGIMDGEALRSQPSDRRGLRDSLHLMMFNDSREPDTGLGRENLREIFLV